MTKYVQCLCVVSMLLLPIISPSHAWVEIYNGPANGYDEGMALAVDDSGNVYVTGRSQGSGTNYDYATIKYDALGDSQWVERYNGLGDGEDWARAIALDNAGNVYVTGWSSGSSPDRDYATIKYDALGDSQWVAIYNGPANGEDSARAIAVDNAGNVFVTGKSEGSGTGADYLTVMYDSLGNQKWEERYNGPGNGEDDANTIAVDNSGNVYITGESQGSSPDRDYATIKYNASGDSLWVEIYNGPANGYDEGMALAVDDSGNVYVTGRSQGSGTNYDYATIKYDALGDSQWVERYNGLGDGEDWARAIALDNAGNVYVTGWSWGSDTDYDYATIRYNASGDSQWVERHNGPVDGKDWAMAIALDDLANVYVTGLSASGTGFDYLTVKYDSLGNQKWEERYNGPGNGQDEANAIAVDSSFVYVTGESQGLGTNYDYATVKYSVTGITEERVASVENTDFGTTILSGPLRLPEGKNCRVFDITGRVVTPDKMRPGIYFIEVEGKITQKVVKIK